MPGEEEIGTLVVVVLKAQNLHNKSFFKQDVYATVTLNGVTKKTKVDVKGGQHPLWDDELRFPVLKDAAKKHRELEVSCWAKEHKDDTLLGEAKVDMTPTVKSGEFDEWVPLSTGEAQRGDIYLEISYYSNAPVPKASLLAAPANLARRPSKLSPAERLHRPTHSALNNAAAKPGPGHAKTGSVPVPTTLKPGPAAAPGGPSPTRLSPTRVSPKQQEKPLPSPVVASPAVPSILQPGNPQANPHPPVRRTSSSPPQQAHATPAAYPTTYGNTPNPYLSSTPVPTFAHNGAVPHTHDSTPNPYLSSTPAQTFNHNGPHNGAIPHAHDHNTPNPYMSSTPAPTFNNNGAIPHTHDNSTPNPYMSSTPAPTFTPNAAIPHTHDNNAPNPYISSTPAPTFTHNGTIPQTHGRSGSIPFASSYSQNSPEFPPPAQDWNTPVSFPVPNFPTVPAVSQPYGSGFYTPSYQGTPPPVHQRTSSYAPPPQASRTLSSDNDLPDPYLMARYQSPLPLPPGAAPHHHRSSKAEPTPHRPMPPVPTHSSSPTLPTHPSTRPSPSPPVPAHPIHPSHPSHPSPPTSPSLNVHIPSPQSEPARSRTPIDQSRLKALRQAEEEAARRREQEEIDMELARRLDQEEAQREERERERQERERQERERHQHQQQEKPAAAPPPPPKSPPPPPYVIVQDEARRKAQEAKDAELARQLDLELNRG